MAATRFAMRDIIPSATLSCHVLLIGRTGNTLCGPDKSFHILLGQGQKGPKTLGGETSIRPLIDHE